jgi:hypothetical protein
MPDPIKDKFVVFSERGRDRKGLIEGIVGANHCLVRFDAETPALRLVKLDRLVELTCSIFDRPEDAGYKPQIGQDDEEAYETVDDVPRPIARA